MKTRIDNEQKQLGEQLNRLKDNRFQYIESRRADLTLQVETICSFLQCSKELLEKGSACDISRSATDLLLRRDQLIISQTKINEVKLQLFNVACDQKKPLVSDGQKSDTMLSWLSLNGKHG